MSKRNTVLVTGGCGFVGRHLIKKLIDLETKEIFVIDNLSTGKHPENWLKDWGFHPTNEKKGELFRFANSKITITFLLDDCINVFQNWLGIYHASGQMPFQFDEAYHLASIVGGRALIDGDPLQVSTDLAIDALFFLWATRKPKPVEKILYASSSASYPVDLQTEETHIALKEEYISFGTRFGMPDMTYGWSKLTGEYLSRLAHDKYGLNVACVRPFSGYGEDQDLTYPVPSITKRIAERQNPIEVWGTGLQGRDFVHIDDCVDAMILIIENISDGQGINIGSGKLTSFVELIDVLADIAGYEPTIKPLVDKPVGVQSRYADITKMETVLNWKPTISLRDGMKRCLDYRESLMKEEQQALV